MVAIRRQKENVFLCHPFSLVQWSSFSVQFRQIVASHPLHPAHSLSLPWSSSAGNESEIVSVLARILSVTGRPYDPR